LEIIRETNKIALVIGNSYYQNGFRKLNSPRNDAAGLGEALKRLGFRLVGGKAHTDVSYEQMLDLVDKFTDEIKLGGVGFFYFSGHGSQDNTKDNFLIPVDKPIKYQSDLRTMALKVEFVTDRMETAGNRLNILVLDACRNNPMPNGFKSGDNGLNTSADIPSGIYIAFAARDGQTALDGGNDGYSLYTRELLKNIEIPNQRLEDIFIKTRIAVKNATNNSQFPFDYGSIDGVFFFKNNGQNPNFANNNITSTQITQSAINIFPFLPIPEKNIKEAERIAELGEDLRKKEDCPLAILNFTDALRLNPNSDYAYAKRGECYRMLGQYDKAIEDLNEAIRRNPQNDYAYSSRAVANWQKGQNDLVLKDLDEAIKLNEKSAWAYLNRGGFQQQNGDCGKAVIDLTKAISLLPDNQNGRLEYGYLNRSYAYLCQNNFEKAVSDLNYVFKINPNSIEALEQRYTIYFQQKEFEKALADSLRLIELNPKESERYYFLRAGLYLQRMLFKESIQELTKVINQNGEAKLIAYSIRGFAYAANENKTQALADVNKAIELSKKPRDMVFAYTFRSLVFLVQEEIKKSLADIETAFKITIDDKEIEPFIKSWLFFMRAGIHFERKKYELALADINLAIRLNSNMPEYYMIRAEIYRKIGKMAEAIADEQKAKKLSQ